MNSLKSGFFGNLKNDLPASIVVFLVAVPLCLGIALASGAPLFSGIIAGIVGGIVVGSLSGSPLGVSGPAAGLAVIVLSSIKELGAFDAFLLAVVIAGAMQFIFGLLKAGVIGYYFPSAVIKGMLAGIGIVIIKKQIPYALGVEKSPMGDFAFMNSGFSLDVISPSAVIIVLLSMLVLFMWERPFMTKLAFTKVIKGPLVVVVGGILLNLAFSSMGSLALRPDMIVKIPVADSLSGFVGLFSLPDFSQWNNPQIYLVAVTIAVVASLETLLCVEATDKLDPYKRVTPTNRELKAQGIGNLVSGLIGGLPVTQVIVRSSANIQSGGRTKASAVVHGFLLLISAMIIPRVLNMIPLASLAAILFMVGYKLAKPTLFREIYSKGRSQFIPFVVTILGIVFIDLLWGIGLGLIVAVVHILWNNYRVPYHFDPANHKDGEPIVIELSEDVSFLNKASIQRTLNELPENSVVSIDASKAQTIHPDIIEIIDDFVASDRAESIQIEVLGLKAKSTNIKDPLRELRDILNSKEPAKVAVHKR